MPHRDVIEIDRHGGFVLGDNFVVKWGGPRQNHLFALDAGRHSYGVAEPQFSLAAWRSAMIVNAVLCRGRFDIDMPPR